MSTEGASGDAWTMRTIAWPAAGLGALPPPTGPPASAAAPASSAPLPGEVVEGALPCPVPLPLGAGGARLPDPSSGSPGASGLEPDMLQPVIAHNENKRPRDVN